VRPTIKIGLVAPFEGRYRYVGYDVIYAVRMALHEVNEAGGIGGYNVELVAYDDRGDPNMAIKQAHKLTVDPDVVAAIGHVRAETTSAALSTYAQENIPLVAPSLDPTITEDKDIVYRLGPSAKAVVEEWLRYLGELNAGRAVLVTEGGPIGAVLQSQEQIPAVSPSEAGWLEVAEAAEVVLCDAAPVTAGEVIARLREADWEGNFLGGPTLAAADFTAVAGDATAGAAFVTPWPFPSDRAGEEFATAYRDMAHGLSPGPLALPAYEATQVLLEALERNIATEGTPTRTGMMSALEATDREGLLGQITFDEAHNWSAAPLYWYRFGRDGKPMRMQ
jgi:branched-chain amino acid transport system substrate-binding protein